MASARVRPPGQRAIKLTPSTRKAPALRGDIDWNPATRKIWRAWWASPMANCWGEDLEGLNGLILLVNDLQNAENGRERAALATEIRLQREVFGLSPSSRRKLGWLLPGEQEPPPRRAARRSPEPAAADFDEPVPYEDDDLPILDPPYHDDDLPVLAAAEYDDPDLPILDPKGTP